MYSFLSNDKQRNAVVIENKEHIGNIKKTTRKKVFIQPKTDKKNVEKTIVICWFLLFSIKTLLFPIKNITVFRLYFFNITFKNDVVNT